MQFDELIKRSRKAGESAYQGTLLCLDPGHTTGFAVFCGTSLAECGEIDTRDLNMVSMSNLKLLLREFNPTELVFEDYRVYKWRAQQHANSNLHTSQLIGAIQLMCMEYGIPYHKQQAQVAKQFAPDAKLKEWGFDQPGMRHARDAIRHGCYFIAYGPKELWSERPGRTSGRTVVG